MGISAPKENEREKSIEHNNPKYFHYLLYFSKNKCIDYCRKNEMFILKFKEEIINFLRIKDINSSKKIMELILKEEDEKIIFVLLDRIIETLIENVNLLSNSKECPPALKASLNTILYSAARLEINELKAFREKIKEKYGQEYLSKAENNEELLVNEVLVEKLKKNIYSEQLIKIRLKSICIEKNIDYQFLDINNENNPEQNNSQIKNSRSNLGQSIIKKTSLNSEDEDNKNINNSDEIVTKDPNKLFIIKKGEDMFLPYDEKIDEKCYKLNKMDN